MEKKPEDLFIRGLVDLAIVNLVDKEISNDLKLKHFIFFEQYLADSGWTLDEFRLTFREILVRSLDQDEQERDELVLIMYKILPQEEINQIMVLFLQGMLEANS